MLIGIVAASNIRYSPYIFYYTSILDSYGIDYELIYADQAKVEDTFEKDCYGIRWNSKMPRSIEFFNYCRKAISIIKKKKYDGLIMLTAITATYCSLFLKKHYSKRYIVDIRDYTHENIRGYYALEKIGITNSALAVISSPQFEKFLPKYDYVVCHNINFDTDERHRLWRKPNPDRIIIGYIGSVGYKDNCISLIKLIRNDPRFELKIHGFEPGEPEVQNLVKEMKCDRISYHGPYLPSDKESIIDSVDVLFNTYGYGCPLLDYALSNKLYDALYYKKLLLTSPNTAMENMGGRIAYSIDYSTTDNLDGLHEWITKLDYDQIQSYQDKKFNEFLCENIKTKELIINTITNWK